MNTKRMGIRVNSPVGEPIRTVTSLDGEWAMKTDPANRGLAEGWAARSLDTKLHCPVPGCVQAVGDLAEAYPSQTGLRNGYLGTVWLERTLDIPAEAAGKQLWLKLGGAAPAVHVWLDGRYVGYHSHAPVSVKWNITGLVESGRTARLTTAIVEEDKGMLGGLRFCDMNWSGLYRTVELEICEAVTVEDIQLRPDPVSGKLLVMGRICNVGTASVKIAPEAKVGSWLPPQREQGRDSADSERLTIEPEWTVRGESVDVEAGGEASFSMTVELPQARLWSCEEPNLYTAAILLRDCAAGPGGSAAEPGKPEPADRIADGLQLRFGMRSFVAAGSALELNGRPFMARGTGQEYFSPTISPLTDRALIRSRFRSVREHGFNFFRCHTYTPTQEELDAADECGLLLVSEIGLVSNFAKTFPFAEGIDVLAEHIVQTRNHPSLAVYCLGNEGSQLMVHLEEERRHAVAGYDTVKRHAPDHVAMIAFGMQGELPELPNDVESPHLWSHEFRLAYEGLSGIPWPLLGELASGKPCIVHEYGKFGVWPDAREETLYPDNGYAQPFGILGREALAAAGIGDLKERIIANSRKLSSLCNRSAIEQARRQPGMDGYVMWTFFRHGGRNAGFVDDMGMRPDQDPALYRDGCNAPLAVLIDHDHDRRTLYGGQWLDIGVSLSNFRGSGVVAASIRWRFEHNGEVWLSGELADGNCRDGENLEVGRIRAIVPACATAAKLALVAEVVADGNVEAANRWDFWAFPMRRERLDSLIVYDFANSEMAGQFRSRTPGAVSLLDYDSALRGCRSWNGPDLAAALAIRKPDLLVTDRLSEAMALFLGQGVQTLLLDGGNLPSTWHALPYPPGASAFDYHRQFGSFRAGWDRGNIATVVEDDALLEGFPQEGYCDAQFFAMIQNADPVITQAVAKSVSELIGASAATTAIRPEDVEQNGLEASAAAAEADGPENKTPDGGNPGSIGNIGGKSGDGAQDSARELEGARNGVRDLGAGCEVIVRSVPRLQSDEASSVVLQDPNARNEQRKWLIRQIATEDRAYLLRIAAGGGALHICSLRLFADPAGDYLLGQMLSGLIER